MTATNDASTDLVAAPQASIDLDKARRQENEARQASGLPLLPLPAPQPKATKPKTKPAPKPRPRPVPKPAAGEPVDVVDLVAALRASIEAAKAIRREKTSTQADA